jgi:hypothetical protein
VSRPPGDCGRDETSHPRDARLLAPQSNSVREFFTKKLCAEIKLARGSFYPSQHTSVLKLVGAANETLLADAYFKGKLAELEAAVDKAKAAGTFGKWLAFMKASKYTEADALL